MYLPTDAVEVPSAWAASRGSAIRSLFGVGRDTLRPEGSTKSTSMPEAAWNEAKLRTLAAAFRSRFEVFLEDLDALGDERGVNFIVWDAARSLDRQVELYGRGRLDKGTVVTRTIASNHLWGCAIDLCVRSPSGHPLFDLPKWWYADALPLAAKHGLRSLWLALGIDPPHVEVPPNEQPPRIVEVKRELVADFKRQPFYADYGAG